MRAGPEGADSSSMIIVSIVGARPQFIKAAVVSRIIRRADTEILVHTGQHYDADMSDGFFRDLSIPAPDVNLAVGSGRHGAQTAAMLSGIEDVLVQSSPDAVLVYGDTNSTLAGALAASKLHVPVVHVEAGLRSYNRQMPEEINRVLTDHISTLLLCPSAAAVASLSREGIQDGVHLVGDVMADALEFALGLGDERSTILEQFNLQPGNFVLATVHRAENTDAPARLSSILRALDSLEEPVIFPVHPRTRSAIEQVRWHPAPHVRLVRPVGYVDMVRLEQAARMILTDSGGVQKEAYWLKVPCITLRDETEWVETVDTGWNLLVGTDEKKVRDGIQSFRPEENTHPVLYGDGHAAERCVDLVSELAYGSAGA